MPQPLCLNTNSGVRSAFGNHRPATCARGCIEGTNEVVISMDLSASSESPRRLTRHATQVCGNVLGEEERRGGQVYIFELHLTD